MAERVALPLPVLQDPVKRVLFQQDADPEVLLVRAVAREKPAIDFLTHLLARLCHLGARRAGVISQERYEPQLERVDAGQVTAVLERESLDIVFPIEVPEIVIVDRVARQVARKKSAQRCSVRVRPDRAEDHGKAPRDRPRAMRQLL